ncbi:hypothetical protein B0T14DRAFT_505763 [Immersiella caudata]|uniref:Uncharacterized protein n=1 Tax=Immersiella caudata TaxID=314043 RepID=A0AA39XFK2_9PEZI|nr:hypothetical protein B0T14DRAFT_505763 [Immersiella caudata]
MASPQNQQLGKRLLRGPLRKPQPQMIATSYTQPRPLKSEISVGNGYPPIFREISLATVSQPFVNPIDALSSLNTSSRTP